MIVVSQHVCVQSLHFFFSIWLEMFEIVGRHNCRPTHFSGEMFMKYIHLMLF